MQRQNWEATMAFVNKTMQNCDPDPSHSKQVTILALAIFDGLRIFHGYGLKERRLLAIAGHLHDIGWSRTLSGKHHKLSGSLITELAIPHLSEKDRITCALVARYHTKAMPDASRHRRFAALGGRRRALVEWLAGMLRVADGLDRNHARTVIGLICSVNGKAVKLHLDTVGSCRMEIARARQKQDLLAKVTGRAIEYHF